MPQRRSAAKSASDQDGKKNSVLVEKPLSLDQAAPLSTGSTEVEPLAPNDNGENYKVRLWKESPFAAGLTEPTWMDERRRMNRDTNDRSIPRDETGCLWISAYLCPFFNATRVGNMIVLKSSLENIESSTIDEETGESVVERRTRPKLEIMVGPFWPMLVFITYPLILGVSGWTMWSIFTKEKHILVGLIWFLCTTALIVSLALTSCVDPGILYRTPEAPNSSWRWTEKAASYRPPKSWFDADTGVIVEDFDHTCPWTGTAIGKKNMVPFQFFVALVFVCLIMDIFILTGAV